MGHDSALQPVVLCHFEVGQILSGQRLIIIGSIKESPCDGIGTLPPEILDEAQRRMNLRIREVLN